MFFSVVLFLAYTDLVYVKTKDILTCMNNTNCNESIDSDTYMKNFNFDDTILGNLSNDEEKNNSYITTTEITTSTERNLVATEQSELYPISTIFTSTSTMSLNNKRNLILQTKEVCECNLIESFCDINCCCDEDCNQFHLSAFSHCQDHHADLYDSRYCYNRNLIQRNNTIFILERLANNLFCILYDNLPSTYYADNNLILQNDKDLWKEIQAKRYKWEIENNKILSKHSLSKHYQHGDILWKLHNGSIQPIEFLQSGFTGVCSFKKTLRYLQNWKGTCIQNELTNTNQYLFPATFNDFTVIKSLKLFNNTFITEQICHTNICLSVTTHYCKRSFSACNKTELPGLCTNFTCTNIVKGLKYVIHHNGSMGLNNIDAYFNIGDASQEFYQYFEIEYKWLNLNKTKVFTRSGNPGYIIGKPIIISNSRVNESNKILFNNTYGYLTLPFTQKNGECNTNERYTINFGEDVKLGCSIKLSTKNFNVSSCIELQNQIIHLLTKDFLLNITQHYNVYISKLGNLSSNDITDWLRVVFNKIPQNIVTARTSEKRILCSGLVTSMRLSILYSTLLKPKTLMNYKILGIGVTFTKEEDFSWLKCVLKNCTDVLHINVLSYVNFYDISKPSKYYFVGGPNLDIVLPYDFFYPFLNSSKNIVAPNILIYLIVHLMFHNIHF